METCGRWGWQVGGGAAGGGGSLRHLNPQTLSCLARLITGIAGPRGSEQEDEREKHDSDLIARLALFEPLCLIREKREEKNNETFSCGTRAAGPGPRGEDSFFNSQYINGSSTKIKQRLQGVEEEEGG